MKRGVKPARHSLLSLLLTGSLLCCVLPLTVFAQNETGITEPEAVAQIETPDGEVASGETERTAGCEADADADADALSDADNEEPLIELTAFAAAGMPSMDEVADSGELEAWLAANPAGGAVTLIGNIEVTDSLELEQVNIDAGDFGFVVTGTLTLRGGVSVTGGGVVPLVRVCDGGELRMFGANDVTATGEGGVALFLEAGSEYLPDVDASPVFRAEGADSAAIYSEIPLDLKRHTIQAADGAGLVDGTEPVRLYFSRVEAEGTVVLPPNVTLDTCIVSPSVSGGTVISRKITGVTTPMPLLLYPGEVPAGFFAGQQMLCNITLTAEGVADTSEKAYFLFDDSGVDYNKPGTYKLRGALMPPYDEFDLVTEGGPLTVTVTFYNPAIPCFYGFYQDPSVFMISYYYSGDCEVLKLWRSDDGGASWRVYWKFGDADSDKFFIGYDYDSFHLIFPDRAELSEPALFVFEVGRGVGSDILYVDAGAVKNVGNGGDRDSGDRILLPWEFFFGNPVNDDSGGGNGSQSLGGSGGNDNGNNGGGAKPKPETAQPHVKDSNGGDNVTAPITPGAAITGAISPAGIAPLDTQSAIVGSKAAAVRPEPVPGAPDKPEPRPVSVGGYVNSGDPAGAMPEPVSGQASVPSPLFPILAAGLTGAGGLACIFRKRRVKSVG